MLIRRRICVGNVAEAERQPVRVWLEHGWGLGDGDMRESMGLVSLGGVWVVWIGYLLLWTECAMGRRTALGQV